MPSNPSAHDNVEPADPGRKAGRAMALSLRRLLNQVRGAREVLPHLAALERGLSADGAAVLDIIPVPSLQRMGAQLASLPVRAEDLPLRALQVQLLAAIERRLPPPEPPPRPYLSTFLGEDRLEVVEISVSEFTAVANTVLDGADQPR